MSSANVPFGPKPIPTATPAATQASSQTAFDSGIWYLLSLWPALNVAVANNWGGPTSSDKRDWFAGAVSDLFLERPDTDSLDLEAVLLQVMQDEFDVNVEDESEVEVAAGICRLRMRIYENGDVDAADEVRKRWEARGGKVEKVNVVENTADDEVSDDEYDGDEIEDVEMGDAEAPPLVPVKEKQEPEVDEDGFQKVVGKRRR